MSRPPHPLWYPAPLAALAAPRCSSSTPASILCPIAIATRTTYINPTPISPTTPVYLSLFSAFSRSGASTYVSSVRIYLSSVVRFRVIKLARAASLGFYLPEKKRINFERRRRFPAGTLFRFVCAYGHTGHRQESHPFRYYLLRWDLGDKYKKTIDSWLTKGERSNEDGDTI